METEILTKIGLTPGESRAYLALLELGMTTVSPISKKADISLSKVYEVLDGLIKKGLASSINKNNVKHYNAADPDRIIDYLEEKKTSIMEDQKEIRAKLPELKLQQALAEKKPIAELYEGIKGIKTYYEKILLDLDAGDKIYTFGIPRAVS